MATEVLAATDVAEMFFIPIGLVLAALGGARTEPLKTAISAVGLVITTYWLVSLLGVEKPTTYFEKSLHHIPCFLAVLWICSTLTHMYRWRCERLPELRITSLQKEIEELKKTMREGAGT